MSMGMIQIKVVDSNKGNERVELEDLTTDCLGSLMHECESLKSTIEDAYRASIDSED